MTEYDNVQDFINALKRDSQTFMNSYVQPGNIQMDDNQFGYITDMLGSNYGVNTQNIDQDDVYTLITLNPTPNLIDLFGSNQGYSNNTGGYSNNTGGYSNNIDNHSNNTGGYSNNIGGFLTYFNDYLTKVDIENDYLTKVDIENDYLTKVDIENDYLTKVDIENDYLTKVDIENDLRNFVNKDDLDNFVRTFVFDDTLQDFLRKDDDILKEFVRKDDITKDEDKEDVETPTKKYINAQEVKIYFGSIETNVQQVIHLLTIIIIGFLYLLFHYKKDIILLIDDYKK